MAPFVLEAPQESHGPRMNTDKSINVRVRHDAKLRVITTWPDGRVDKNTMTPEGLEGHLLTLGCLYNVSGYYNPYKPKVRYWFMNKKRDWLKEGELCSCKRCLE